MRGASMCANRPIQVICRTISPMNFLIDKTDTPWRARPAGRTADPSDPATLATFATLDFKDH